VLLDQGGVPVPAYPPIILTAALATDRGESLWPIVLVAALAAVAADWLWYVGGRRLGAKLLRLMCRLSLSPDSCVLMTRGIYGRWGPPSLIVAKFIPGFAAVATTLAGETGTRAGRFLLFDGIGALLWAGLAVALGAFFHEAVNSLLEQLETLGRLTLPAVLALIAGLGVDIPANVQAGVFAVISVVTMVIVRDRVVAPMPLAANGRHDMTTPPITRTTGGHV